MTSNELLKVARKMRKTSEDNYIGDGDYRMQREYGMTPNGNSIRGRWVLRGPNATDHRNACTGSNEPGQPGSVYA